MYCRRKPDGCVILIRVSFVFAELRAAVSSRASHSGDHKHCKVFERRQGLASTPEYLSCCSYGIGQEVQLAVGAVLASECTYTTITNQKNQLTPLRFLVSPMAYCGTFISPP